MNTAKYCSALFLVFSFFYSLSFIGQVTIGANSTPLPGSLLDLKENNNAGANTNKGLGLPRVELSALDKLKMGNAAEISNSTERLAHAGLLVYNVFEGNNICKGLHLWTGEQWQPIGNQSGGNTKPDISMTDGDGNVYVAKWIPYTLCNNTHGAYWTATNIYSTRKGNGTALTTLPVKLNPALGGIGNLYSGPETYVNSKADLSAAFTINFDEGLTSTSLVAKSMSKLEYAKIYGLNYNQFQALELCPSGWHLPSAADWDELIDSYGGLSEAGVSLRGGGPFYRAHNDNVIVHWGKNDPPNAPRSGLNILPAGEASNNVARFGLMAYVWASNPLVGYVFSHDQKAVVKTTGFVQSSNAFSVRCIKD